MNDPIVLAGIGCVSFVMVVGAFLAVGGHREIQWRLRQRRYRRSAELIRWEGPRP